MSDRRREKELKRKHKKEHKEGGSAPVGAAMPAASKDLVARELGEPQRLIVHLHRLSQLMTMVDELRPARFNQEKLIAALLELAPDLVTALPEGDRGIKLREQLLPKLVDDTLAKQARAAFNAALKQARTQEDQLALFAGRMFMDNWIRAKGAPHQNPAWDALLGISLLDSLFEGHFLASLIRSKWEVDEGAASKSFAKALAKAEVASELESLGLEEREPQALARTYAEVAREKGKTYLLGFDSLLHLVRANHDLASKHVKTLLSEGASTQIRDHVRDGFENAYKDDVTQPLAHDLANEIVRRLTAMKKGGDEKDAKVPPETKAQEKRVALAALASLRAIPLEHNAVLRNTYLASFEVYKSVAPSDEVPFVRRIWGDPTERWGLEEYEKYLIERRQSHRAARVHRFLSEIRAESKEAEEKKATTP